MARDITKVARSPSAWRCCLLEVASATARGLLQFMLQRSSSAACALELEGLRLKAWLAEVGQ